MVPAIDLFAGAGGMTLGMKEAGVSTLCAVEIEPNRVLTFAGHTPNADIKNADIRRLDLSLYQGQVELIYGGPPCQPFSSGGRRQADADTRNMIPAFLQALDVVKPAAFLMENVPGLLVGDRIEYFRSVVQAMQDLGYRVSHKILNAADFGVPQKRRRLFVVGMRDRAFHFPRETHGPGRPHPHVAVKDVLPPHRIGAPNASKVFFAKKPDLRPSPFDGHVYNGGGRPIDRDRPCHTILASAGGNKTHFFDELGLVPEYHRSLLDGNPPRTGTLPGARRLTVLESALIQTFPKEMVFSGPPSVQYHQVGDAVPPRLAAVLGQALVKQLAMTRVEARGGPEGGGGWSGN